MLFCEFMLKTSLPTEKEEEEEEEGEEETRGEERKGEDDYCSLCLSSVHELSTQPFS